MTTPIPGTPVPAALEVSAGPLIFSNLICTPTPFADSEAPVSAAAPELRSAPAESAKKSRSVVKSAHKNAAASAHKSISKSGAKSAAKKPMEQVDEISSIAPLSFGLAETAADVAELDAIAVSGDAANESVEASEAPQVCSHRRAANGTAQQPFWATLPGIFVADSRRKANVRRPATWHGLHCNVAPLPGHPSLAL